MGLGELAREEEDSKLAVEERRSLVEHRTLVVRTYLLIIICLTRSDKNPWTIPIKIKLKSGEAEPEKLSLPTADRLYNSFAVIHYRQACFALQWLQMFYYPSHS